MTATKSGAALLSIASNSALIALKLFAAILTGSIAILMEAIHSAVDLMASVVAFISIRKAAQPADRDHPYGHEKVENIAAGAEAMLILVGALIVGIEAASRLTGDAEVEQLGIGIGVIAVSLVANLFVSRLLYRRAGEFDSPVLEGDAAHLRADALTSAAVLVGLVLIEITGEPIFDALAALVVAVAIVATGVRLMLRSGRVLMDEALPSAEMDRVEEAIAAARPPEMAGYHKLRGRRAGAMRHIDFHVQFVRGTSLERAHHVAHALRNAVEAEFPAAEVLIHLEPEDSLLPAGLRPDPFRSG